MFRVFLFAALIATFMLVPGIALAQDDPAEEEGEEEPAPSEEPTPAEKPVPAEEPVAEAVEPEGEAPSAMDATKRQSAALQQPHWFNLIWRSGFGANGSQFKLEYRDAPEGAEDTFEASGGGNADLHLLSGWFFPTRKRHFMVTFGIGGGSGNGRFTSSAEDEEFLDEKQYWYSYWYSPIGLGYRWLVGSRDQVSLNLFAEAGWMRQTLHLEGAEDPLFLNGGGGGLFFGAHYRYLNGFLLGGAIESRGFSGGQKDTRLAGELVDGRLSGNMFVISLILGWEPGRMEVVR
jgi:hypothetical protein